MIVSSRGPQIADDTFVSPGAVITIYGTAEAPTITGESLSGKVVVAERSLTLFEELFLVENAKLGLLAHGAIGTVKTLLPTV